MVTATSSQTPSLSTREGFLNSSPKKRILILGAGPAGSTTAYFLARAGFHVTVAELSTLTPYGQGIDITDEAVNVVKSMGLWEKIKAHTTGETGFALLDDAGGEIGRMGITAAEESDGKRGLSPSQEVEIMRGTLTKILTDAAKAEGVEYRYGCTATSITQNPDGTTATFNTPNSTPETFSAMIGADGLASRTRSLAFPRTPENTNPYRQTDTYCAYFSMDTDPSVLAPAHSRLQHGTKGRVIWIRPIDAHGTKQSCYFLITSPNNSRLQEISVPGAASDEERKAFLQDMHQDMAGLREEAVKGMHASKDFYFTRVVQVVLPTWHHGRCGLVGDAAYCPSPLTGQGTSLALIGAYMIAGELATNPEDPAAAFAEYQRKLHGHVKIAGQIPLGGRAPRIFQPQSQLAIWALRTIFRAVSRVDLPGWLTKLPSFGQEDQEKKFRVPKYPFA